MNDMSYRPATGVPAYVQSRIEGLERLGMEPIPVAGFSCNDFHVLEAYLGKDLKSLWFGTIKAVVQYHDRDGKGDRYFILDYHIWEPHQRPADANRLSNLQEIVPMPEYGPEASELVHPADKFGFKAFWAYTPDRSLDWASYGFRRIGRHFKEYSVVNRLCEHFRKAYRKGPVALGPYEAAMCKHEPIRPQPKGRRRR